MRTASNRLVLAGAATLVGALTAVVTPSSTATAAPTAPVPGPAAAGPRGAAPVQDPDRVSTAPTGSGWHTSVSASTMSDFIDTGQRLTDLEVTSASPLRFSAAYVSNKGTYQRGWWWYYGQTAAQVGQKLTANAARLTDIEAYSTTNGIRYAVVMVKNSGSAAKAWGWYSSATLTQIGTYASQNNMPVIDSDRFTSGGQTRYSAVFVRNSGVDAVSWWHYYGLSAAAVGSRLDTNKARLINLERNSNGTFDVIMTKGGFSGSWWYLTGRTSSQVNEFVGQVGGRIFHVDSRVVSGSRFYDVLVLDNTDSETRRIRNLVGSKMSGKWGFYTKRVGSGVLTGLNQDGVFEPASMMKIVHAVTALREVQNTATTLTTNATWKAHPSFPARYPGDSGYNPNVAGVSNDKDVCAYDGDGADNATVSTTYSDDIGPVLVDQTLEFSDNRTTDGLFDRYGASGLNATIDLAGMTRSKVVHRIGCGSTWADGGAYHNKLSLADSGRIYEGIQNGTLLDTTHRNVLYGYLLGGPISTTGSLADMINAEATAAGLTSAERADFVSRVVTRSKGGSYGLCPDTGDTCNPPTVSVGTVGGVIFLPRKVRGLTVDTPFVYGRFLNVQINCSYATIGAGSCTALNEANTGLRTVSVEMFRAAVKQVLASW